jgi:hypothetical protein
VLHRTIDEEYHLLKKQINDNSSGESVLNLSKSPVRNGSFKKITSTSFKKPRNLLGDERLSLVRVES